MWSPETIALIAGIIGTGGISGVIIALLGHRNQRSKPAAISPETLAIAAQGHGHQMAIDELNLRIDKLCLVIDINTTTLQENTKALRASRRR